MADEKTRVNVVLPERLLQAAKLLADRRGTSYSQIIRSALREYVIEELRRDKAQDVELEV